MGLENRNFSAVDYTVFVSTFAVSLGIGLYYGLFRKQDTNVEFLMAGKSMGVFPISMSLLLSFISSITVLALPAEMYYYGVTFSIEIPAIVIALLLTIVTFLPLLYNLSITSAYEYLERRFESKLVRQITTVSFMAQTFLYMAVVLYSPAVALSVVTPLTTPVSILLVGVVCTIYTSLGGLRAVLWTDSFQVIIMILGMFAIVIKGCNDLGGIEEVWRIASERDRTQLTDFSLDPTHRMTFWSCLFGLTLLWFCFYGTTQTQVQRYLSAKSYSTAKWALLVNIPIMCIVKLLAFLSGFVAFAVYADCDPLTAGIITEKDQLMPYYVIDKLGSVPGVSGIYIASVFCASLSTLSSGLNSLATVTWEDFLLHTTCGKWIRNREWSVTLSKITAIFYGFICIGVAFLVGSMGTILDAILKVNGALVGPPLGAFLLAAFNPFSNKYGAAIGMLSAHIVTWWLAIGSIVNNIKPDTRVLSISTEKCYEGGYALNSSFIETKFTETKVVASDTDGMDVYKIAPMLYSSIAVVMTVVIGCVVSPLTGGFPAENLDPSLVIPFMKRFASRRSDDEILAMQDTDSKKSDEDSLAASPNGGI